MYCMKIWTLFDQPGDHCRQQMNLAGAWVTLKNCDTNSGSCNASLSIEQLYTGRSKARYAGVSLVYLRKRMGIRVCSFVSNNFFSAVGVFRSTSTACTPGKKLLEFTVTRCAHLHTSSLQQGSCAPSLPWTFVRQGLAGQRSALDPNYPSFKTAQ